MIHAGVDSAAAPHETLPVLTSAMLTGAAAMLILGVAPILFGGLAEAGKLSSAGVGQVATLETLGLALGATIGPFAMRSGHMRAKAVLASLILAIMNIAVRWANHPIEIIVDRAVAGLLEGLILGATIVVLTHHSRPERMNGLLLGVSAISQMAVAYALPVLVIPRYGVDAGFLILAAAACLSAGAAMGLVDRVEAPSSIGPRSLPWSPAIAAFITAAFLQSAGIGAAWNFIERLAAQHHYGAQVVGAAVAGSLAFQVLGSLLAAWICWRLPTRATLIIGAFLLSLVVAGLTLASEPSAYVALACAFGFFWLALQPFQVVQLIALDSTRTLAVLTGPITLIGLSAGPFIASFAVRGGQVAGAFWTAVALLLAAVLLYVISRSAERQAGRTNGLPAM